MFLKHRQMNGKELEGLSFQELNQLEHQLSEGIFAVKDKKVSVTIIIIKSFIRTIIINKQWIWFNQLFAGASSDGAAEEVKNAGKQLNTIIDKLAWII